MTIDPDVVNGCFEFAGAFLTWKNFAVYCRERMVAGIYWPGQAFWVGWGLWNLFYYTALHQPLSYMGGIALTGGTAAWLAFVAFDKWMRWLDSQQEEFFDFDDACATRGDMYCSHEGDCAASVNTYDWRGI